MNECPPKGGRLSCTLPTLTPPRDPWATPPPTNNHLLHLHTVLYLSGGVYPMEEALCPLPPAPLLVQAFPPFPLASAPPLLPCTCWATDRGPLAVGPASSPPLWGPGFCR